METAQISKIIHKAEARTDWKMSSAKGAVLYSCAPCQVNISPHLELPHSSKLGCHLRVIFTHTNHPGYVDRVLTIFWSTPSSIHPTMTMAASNSALSAQSLLDIMVQSLSEKASDESSPVVKDPYAAVGLFAHACMLAVGFRLVGLGEDHKIGSCIV